MASLNSVRSLADPARSFNFEVQVPNLPGGGNGEELGMRVTSTSIPGFQSEPTEVALGGGHVVSYAGRGTYSREWTFSAIEGENMVVYDAIERWHGLQWDRSTGSQRPSQEYKTDVYIVQLNGQKAPVKKWRLEGCFVSTLGDGAVDHNSSEALRLDVTLRYDNIVPVSV